MPALDSLARRLAALDARGRGRRLTARSGIDFASNDYLALAGDRTIADAIAAAAARGIPAGSGGSRLLRGNAPEHEALEAHAAHFWGSEAALFFSAGFAANAAMLACLPQRGDLIVADALIHASAHDGIALARTQHILTPHNDAGAVEDAIIAWRADGGRGTAWIVVESLYSMDGDLAPLAELHAIANRHEAMLIVDEAHGTGIFGAGGRGLTAALAGRGNVITLHTCGKALGVEGAIVAGPQIVIDYLINRARGFVFSTAPSPLIAVGVQAAIDRMAGADDRRQQLTALMAHARSVLCEPIGAPHSASPIVPIILGDDRRAVAIANACREAGFDVRAVRPPTVPLGTSRLRIALTCNITPADIDALAPVLHAAMRDNP